MKKYLPKKIELPKFKQAKKIAACEGCMGQSSRRICEALPRCWNTNAKGKTTIFIFIEVE